MVRITGIVNNTIKYDVSQLESWLDIGTGNGQVVKGLKWNDKKIKRFYVEPHRPDDFCLSDEWTQLSETPRIGHYSIISLFDVIEHLHKDAGLVLISQLKEMADHIIIFTPRGFLQQDEDTHPQLVKDNPLQKHLSGWTEGEFEELGFQTKVLSNFHNPTGVPGFHDGLLAWL